MNERWLTAQGKKVFIFGAGASRASQEAQKRPQEEDHVAPLVNELFRRSYQDAAFTILDGSDFDRCLQETEHAIETGSNLEGWLTDRWEAVQTFGAQKRHAENAFFGRVCFYLWRLLQRVSETYQGANGNTYHLLLTKLIERDEEFALISFNYDTLLDRAAKEVYGALLDSVDSYLNVPLIKPHGSVNWLLQRNGDPEDRAEEPAYDESWLSRATSLMFNGGQFDIKDWTVVDPTHKALRGISTLRGTRSGYFYPLLFMPVTTKWYETVKGFHGKMIKHAQQEIRNAKAVCVIGYSASDEVFAEIMDSAQEGTSLCVVGHGERGVREIEDRIGKRHPQLRLEKGYAVGFRRFVDEWF